MNTNLKVILTAVSIAVLASPVMAASGQSHASASISNAHGSLVGTRTAPVIQGNNPFNIDDAVHVAFPQRDGGV
jgi:hypothetical protein